MPHSIIFFEEFTSIHAEVITNNPSIRNKYSAIQILRSLCLLLLSTFTPAGKAKETAEITSDKPRMPRDNLLPVTWYNLQPNNTGVIRRPAIKRIRVVMNQVNSLLMIVENSFFIKVFSFIIKNLQPVFINTFYRNAEKMNQSVRKT